MSNQNPLNRNIETFLGCETEYEASRIVLYGAPFDSTTSYRPGTRFATGPVTGRITALSPA